MANDTEQIPSGSALVPIPEGTVDQDMVDLARGAVASGHLSHEEIKRHFGLTNAEIAEARKPKQPTRSIERELADLRKLRREDPKRYLQDEVQARELKLLKMREASVEAGKRDRSDGSQLPAELREAWEGQGGLEANLTRVQDVAETVLLGLDQTDAAALQESFDALPQSARSTVFSYLAVDGGGWPPASQADLKAFAESDEGKELAAGWGRKAPKMLATVRGRLRLILNALPEGDKEATAAWFDDLTPAQAKAVLGALAGR